ncbi:MAG: ribosome recycling factor [Endomicrobiales bacterium]|nr:ribosome recycling factor [Endomicrobiales bacterium]
MIVKTIVAQGEEPMKRTLEKMKGDFAALRTGRANTALVENLKVESYGTVMPINQLAGLGIPDARTIEIKPWDHSQLQNIEKAIQKSELGLTPMNDGKLIRLSLPKLTEERRKEIIKITHKMAEDFKVAIRNERRQIIESIKQAEKDKKITEDDRKKGEAELQKLTDSYIKKIDDVLALKEKEVMEV